MQLSDFQTPDGWFTIAPFDHRGSLAKSLKLDLNLPGDQEKFLLLKRLFIKILSPHVSSVLTDPEYGVQTLDDKDPHCGLFLSLEESGYDGSQDDLTFLKSNWGVDGIKQHNAGAKILVYYHPQSSTAKEKLSLVQSLAQECKQKGVVFLVEPLIYELHKGEEWENVGDERWIQLHLEMCRQFAPFCDILKIHYPGSPDACKEISTFHNNWVLLSRGVGFEEFCELMKISVRSGSKGYAAGRAVWQEITSLDSSQWEGFLQTTAVERIKKLNQILKTSTLVA